MSKSPVRGLKVLDLSKVLAGPLCAQYLGDMGAEVIKVETPGVGDDTRDWPPLRPTSDGKARAGAVFLSANRNKRSIAIDLRQPAGRELLHRMVREADVLIESYGPGVAARLGVDPTTVRALNPRIVHCAISGFGSVGPMRHAKGYDVITQAFCGMVAVTGEPDGTPVRSPFSPVDQATGLNALAGILAALLERTATGTGQLVEASLFDTATAMMGYFLQSFWQRGTEPQRMGSGHESLCPYQVFATADKPLILGVANDALWRRFCDLAQLQWAAEDPRFRTNPERVAHREETLALVRAALAPRTRDEWIALLERNGIPCSPVHTLGELSEHPHTRESGMVTDYAHPAFGEMRTVSLPLRFDGERTAVRRPVPLHSEHAREILGELGLESDEIRDLSTRRVVDVHS